jgi:hypothetical protein
MTQVLVSTKQRKSGRAARLLCAAAAGVAVEFGVAGTSRALERPDLTVCEVYQGQAPYAESRFHDYDFKPLFYVEWDNGGDYASGVVFNFFQGIGVTTVGSNCWQVYHDPDGLNSLDADWGALLWCPPDDTSISFYPWNFDFGTLDYDIDLLDFDSDDPTIYEIGVEANDGDPTDNITAWIGASFDT